MAASQVDELNDDPFPSECKPTIESIIAQLKSVRDAFEQGHTMRKAKDAGITDLTLWREDPLPWWKALCDRGHHNAIAHLPRIIHCVPATSAASERIFSSAGRVATSGRASLSQGRYKSTVDSLHPASRCHANRGLPFF